MCTGRPEWKTFNLKSLNKKEMTKIKMDLEDIVLIDEQEKVRCLFYSNEPYP